MNKFSDQQILSDNFSRNKNVLLLIGHLRTIKYLIKYHKKFLSNTKSDLIISTWIDEQTKKNFDIIKKN